MTSRFERFTADITALYRCIQKIKAVEMTELGLKGGHVMCLYYLYRHPDGLTAAELGLLCDEDKAAVSRTVSQLENRGFVVCRQTGDKKRYRAKLELTSAGREVAADVNLRVENAVNYGGRGLSEEEREAFYASLQKIAQNLQDYCGKIDGDAMTEKSNIKCITERHI